MENKLIQRGTVVAKTLTGRDMDYMYISTQKMPGLCPVCQNTLEKIPDLSAKIKRRKGNVFGTCDGFYLVSQQFKDFCEENHYPNLTFQPMNRMKGLYYFMPNNLFYLDDTILAFGPKRECCGSYDWVSHAWVKSPCFHLDTDDFISRTDYFIGDFGKKFVCIVVGLETEKKMKAAGIGGLDFDNIYDFLKYEPVIEKEDNSTKSSSNFFLQFLNKFKKII